MSLTGNKVKNNDVVCAIISSGWFRVNKDGRIETTYQWRACKEYTDRPWFICDRADGKGYLYISFRGKRVKAHRVAYALYHNAHLGDFEINHIDGNRLNNKKENLELCDAVRQSKHAYDCGLNSFRGEKHHKAKLSEDAVLKIRKRFSSGESFKEIASSYSVTKECIRYVCVRHTWKHVE